MLKELCEYLVRRGEAATQVFVLSDTPDNIRRMVQSPSGELSNSVIPKPPAQQHHVMADIPSLAAFTRAKATTTTEVWVDAEQIAVKLQPESNQIGIVTLPLEKAESYRTFLDLQEYRDQGDWMEALRGPLSGCIPAALALQMASLTVGRRGVKNITVDDLGVKNSNEEIGLKVTRSEGAEGAEGTALKVEWTYKGPIWLCVPDLEVEVEWRLMPKDQGNGVAFAVCAARLEMVEADALRRLGQVVRQELNGDKGPESKEPMNLPIPVYAGVPMYRPWDARPVERD